MAVLYARDLFARFVLNFQLTWIAILFVHPVTSRGGRKSVMQIPTYVLILYSFGFTSDSVDRP